MLLTSAPPRYNIIRILRHQSRISDNIMLSIEFALLNHRPFETRESALFGQDPVARKRHVLYMKGRAWARLTTGLRARLGVSHRHLVTPRAQNEVACGSGRSRDTACQPMTRRRSRPCSLERHQRSPSTFRLQIVSQSPWGTMLGLRQAGHPLPR